MAEFKWAEEQSETEGIAFSEVVLLAYKDQFRFAFVGVHPGLL